MTSLSPSGSLGQRVRHLRELRRMSQRDLGDGLVSPSHVSLIESDSREPSPGLLNSLADRLQTSAEYLRTGFDDGTRAALELRIRMVESQLLNGEASIALAEVNTLLAQAPTALKGQLVALRARALENLGRHREAIHDLEDLAKEASTRQLGPSALTCAISLSRNYRELGELTCAVGVAERSLQRAELDGLQATPQYEQLVATLAAAHLERGDVTRAEWLLSSALSAASSGDPAARGSLLWNLALTSERRGDISLARELVEQAQLHFSGWSDERNRARLLIAVAGLNLRCALPDLDQAREQLRLARTILTACGSLTDLAYCASERARLALLAGDPAESITAAREALHGLSEDDLEAGRALAIIAQAWAALGDDSAAQESLRLAATSLQKAQAGRQAARAWRELAELTQRLGDVPLANKYLCQALDAAGVQLDADLVRHRDPRVMESAPPR